MKKKQGGNVETVKLFAKMGADLAGPFENPDWSPLCTAAQVF